jgi:uncharacterized protein (DUF736 family)
MAIIGTFKKQDNGGYDGIIETLTLGARATFELLTKRGEKSPDYRIMSGPADIGAAWERTTNDGEKYLSVRIDDPSFAAPIDCRLVKASIEHCYSLVWDRKRKRD